MSEPIITLKDTIEFSLYGGNREAHGISKVILAPVAQSVPVKIGTVVEYRMVAIHHETVER